MGLILTIREVGESADTFPLFVVTDPELVAVVGRVIARRLGGDASSVAVRKKRSAKVAAAKTPYMVIPTSSTP